MLIIFSIRLYEYESQPLVFFSVLILIYGMNEFLFQYSKRAGEGGTILHRNTILEGFVPENKHQQTGLQCT